MEPKRIYASARELTGDPRHYRLALVSAGVVVAANLLLLLLETLIGHMLTDAIGLAALGKRTALMTVQSVCELAVNILLPFWVYGFMQVAMEIARKGEPTYSSLLAGFRRFGPLLRLMLLETLIASGFIMLAVWGSSMLYMLSPFAARIIEDITPALEQAQTITDSAALSALMEPVMEEMLKDLWPFYLLLALSLGVLLIPWLYKLRLAPYHILDGENGALRAMALSKYEMHGNRFAMFLLDLRWWWYYGLLILSAAPLYIYTYVGGSEAFLWLMTLVSLGLQLVAEWLLMPRVQTSYALAYDALKRKDKTDVPPIGTPPQF